ncbi:hypothetical protein ACNAW0_02150 [Micromonospora sp. SL1-18]|uniref:hypothetical protein n=1 Tax=Micromonospora sp. SL1-18 TaxID=3399128 RepID=UPI003A4E606F
MAIREADWGTRLVSGVLVGVAVAVVACWWFALGGAWDGIRAVTVGVPGSVAVTCEESTAQRDPQFWTLGWSCTGPFTSSAGDVHIDSVRLFMHADERPGPNVTGRVNGPGATWMWPDGEIEWLFAAALAVGLPFAARYFLRHAVEVLEPLDGWPKPRRKRREGPPQLGNRARRRRRKRRSNTRSGNGPGRARGPVS